MATCRDCIHHEICVLLLQNTDAVCNGFADKSQYVELPCKVGGILYCIIGDEVCPVKIQAIVSTNWEDTTRNSISLYCGHRYEDLICRVDDIGRYGGAFKWHDGAFYTREEAEEALRKVKKERIKMTNLKECCMLKDGDEE